MTRLSDDLRHANLSNQNSSNMLLGESLPQLSEQSLSGVGSLSEGISRQLHAAPGIKVAVSQLKTRATRIDENSQKIIDSIEQAKDAGVELLVFPELAIPGYLSLDNFLDPEFISKNIEGLKEIIEASHGSEMTIVVGFADMEINEERSKPTVFNSAAVISNGELIDVIDKTLLPDYDIFWENRYFKSADTRHIVEVKSRKIGIEICEDLWDKDYGTKVTEELAKQGAELIVNISASPFHAGKYQVRHSLVSEASAKHKLPLIYANMVGTQDGYEGEVVFDGRSMIVDADGKLTGMGKEFDEDLLIVDFKNSSEILLPEWEAVEEIHAALVLGIKDFFERCGFRHAYIGLSGGIDSAVVASLAVDALGAENVIGVTMPSHITSDETRDDALLLAKNLGIRCDSRPIVSQYNAWHEGAKNTHENCGKKLAPITKQNVQARLRGQTLMEYTNEDREGLVISTGNKTEMALGYTTLYGDMCGGVSAIGDVNKEMVYKLAAYHNILHKKEIIPETTIERPPTAELEKDQLDRDNLPADYPVLSPLVDSLVDHEFPKSELYRQYDQNTVDRTARMISQNEFKRRQAAPSFKVTAKSFGAGRRFPIDNKHY